MYCNYCGGENPDDAIYCGHCARPLHRPAPTALQEGEGQQQPPPPPIAVAPPPPQSPPAVNPSATLGVPYTCVVCGYILGSFEHACPRCKTPRGMRVDPNATMPGTFQTTPSVDAGMVNTSGMRSSVPLEIRGGWNWGGCLLGWIWCFAMQLPLWGMLSLLSNLASIFIGLFGLVNFALAIVFGIKGNEWAWQNRRFDSVEHFRKVQRIWMIWGIVITLFFITLFFIAFWVMIVLFVGGIVVAAQPWR